MYLETVDFSLYLVRARAHAVSRRGRLRQREMSIVAACVFAIVHGAPGEYATRWHAVAGETIGRSATPPGPTQRPPTSLGRAIARVDSLSLLTRGHGHAP